MLGSLQEQVRAANARLPERQREVLALRELEELSYDEIAEMMDMNRNSVAQLISRARIKLRDELRGSALASVAAATPDDERAAGLIAERMDGELTDDEDRAWLEEYLRDNERGRAMVECMLEAGTSYRAWLPIVPAIWLRDAAIAKAAESVGADWSAQTAGATDSARSGAGGSALVRQPLPGGGIGRRPRRGTRRERPADGATAVGGAISRTSSRRACVEVLGSRRLEVAWAAAPPTPRRRSRPRPTGRPRWCATSSSPRAARRRRRRRSSRATRSPAARTARASRARAARAPASRARAARPCRRTPGPPRSRARPRAATRARSRRLAPARPSAHDARTDDPDAAVPAEPAVVRAERAGADPAPAGPRPRSSSSAPGRG